jgi:general secretion pathway protein A
MISQDSPGSFIRHKGERAEMYLGRCIASFRIFSVRLARRAGLPRLSRWLLEPCGIRKLSYRLPDNKVDDVRPALQPQSNNAVRLCESIEGESNHIAVNDPTGDTNEPLMKPSDPPERRANMNNMPRTAVETMFLEHYSLNEQPFGVTPDLRFLYLSSNHRQALDVLNYGTELNRGFLTLTAEAGMGKTSLLFHYLESLAASARTVFVFQTDAGPTHLMRYVLADLGIDAKGMDLPEMREVLSQVLLGEMQAGRRVVLVIDEAQNLDERTLESVRLLSNFERPWTKLLHIVLSGQPQLGERLAQPEMKQLRQRISFAVHLEPFTRQEVNHYINHRLCLAGYKGAPLFSEGALTLMAEHSEGIPRNINNLCFCAMSYAWGTKRKTIDRDMMSEVLEDLDLEWLVRKRTEDPHGLSEQKRKEPKPTVAILSQPTDDQSESVTLAEQRKVATTV